MPSTGDEVTDSWNVYQQCMRSIQDFLHEIEVRDSEVWLGDVCFGSPDHPCVRAPLQVDSVGLVHRSVEHAQALIAAVKGSLQGAVETSRRVMKELSSKGVDKADLAAIMVRTDSLEQLLSELTSVATLTSIGYHPAILIRWCDILGRSFVPGDPAVRVKVVTVYVL